MNAKKRASRRILKSDLERVDAHIIQSSEYEELPELTEETFARAQIKREAVRGRSTRGSSSPCVCQQTSSHAGRPLGPVVGRPEWLTV